MPSLEGLEWGRLGLLGAGLLVVVLVLLLAARSCGGSSATSKNQAYFDQVKQVLATSDGAGQKLHALFHSQRPIHAAAAVKQLDAIRALAQKAVVDAGNLKPTKQTQDLQIWLVEALAYRVNGLNCLASGLPVAYKQKNSSAGGAKLVGCTQRLLASDLIYTDSFYARAQKTLHADNIDVAVPTSTFLAPGDQTTLTAAGMGAVLERWKPGSVAHGLHGLNLVTVVARSGDGKTVTLQPSTLTPVKATGLSFLVTAHNGGNFTEFNVLIKVTIGSGSSAIKKSGTIPQIAKGTSETVTIGGFSSGSSLPQFGKPITMKVEVVPVPGEHTTSNNSQSYQITFSL